MWIQLLLFSVLGFRNLFEAVETYLHSLYSYSPLGDREGQIYWLQDLNTSTQMLCLNLAVTKDDCHWIGKTFAIIATGGNNRSLGLLSEALLAGRQSWKSHLQQHWTHWKQVTFELGAWRGHCLVLGSNEQYGQLPGYSW